MTTDNNTSTPDKGTIQDLTPVRADDANLTELEARRLADLESEIEQHVRGFMATGLAMLAIRDERLYRDTHATFEEYVAQRWGLSRSHAYRLMDAAKITNHLAEDELPSNEAQARELVRIAERKSPEVMRQVYAEARKLGGGVPTAKLIAQVEKKLSEPVVIAEGRPVPAAPNTPARPMTYRVHGQLETLIPEVDEATYERIRDSINDYGGLRTPIVLWNNHIIDGRARHRACDELGLIPEFTDFKGDEDDVIEFILDANVNRRHLRPEDLPLEEVEGEAIEPNRDADEQSRLADLIE